MPLKTRRPGAHQMLAHALGPAKLMNLQQTDQMVACLLRPDHRLDAEDFGNSIDRIVTLHLPQGVSEFRTVRLMPVNDANREMWIHETDLGPGPRRHLIRVTATAHVQIRLPVAFAHD